jgi:hypothetical protein
LNESAISLVFIVISAAAFNPHCMGAPALLDYVSD